MRKPRNGGARVATIVDGRANSQRIVLPEGVGQGQTSISYSVVAPF